MKKKRRRHRRHCSLCAKTGHDRRNCPTTRAVVSEPEMVDAVEEVFEEPSVVITPPVVQRATDSLKKSVRKTAIFVRSHTKDHHSPHVVDLRDDVGERELDTMPTYKERPATKRVVLPMGDLIAKANKRSQAHVQMKQTVAKTNSRLSRRRKKKKAFRPVAPAMKRVEKAEATIRTVPEMFRKKQSTNVRPRAHVFSSFSFERLSSWLASVPQFFLATRGRLALGMCLLAIVALAPFPAVGYYRQVTLAGHQVIEQSTNGFFALQASTAAAFGANLPQAQADLSSALSAFANAHTILEQDHQVLITLAKFIPIVRGRVLDGQHILEAGQQLAVGNTYLLKGVAEANAATDMPLTERVAIVHQHLRSALANYEDAQVSLAEISATSLPVEYQQQFVDFKFLFGALVDDMQDVVDLAGAIQTVFGQEDFRRYLIVLQNHHELRPTGGFMGSFAIADFQKGKLLSLDLPGGGTYDLQGQLSEYVEPPVPLQLLNKRWEFQDANWFPDFAASAEKSAWFYQHGRHSTVDGVIALNASVLERFLKVIGPQLSEEYGLLLTADSALSSIEQHVEYDYDKDANAPKQILADVLDQFLQGIGDISTVDSVRLLAEVHEALEQKDIQIYLADAGLQNQIRQFGWTGEIIQPEKEQDYLHVSVANIGGGKSDVNTSQTIEHQSVIGEDGSVTNTVVIRRKHDVSGAGALYDGDNIAYVRVYVPKESELIDVGGFEYPPEHLFHVPESWYESDEDLERHEEEVAVETGSGTRITAEFDKTVFGNWMITRSGEESVAYIVYRLPFSVMDTDSPGASRLDTLLSESSRSASGYSLFVQRQSGALATFTKQIIYPDGWMPVWKSDDTLSLAKNGASLVGPLLTDMVLGVVMEQTDGR